MKVLITGMSGTGKTTLLEHLALRGWDVVETDDPGWKIRDANADEIWDEAAMHRLLTAHPTDHRLAVQGTVPNQGKFYEYFDAVIALTADLETILNRVTSRTENPYGHSVEDRQKIAADKFEFEPIILASADLVIDTSNTNTDEIVRQILLYIDAGNI